MSERRSRHPAARVFNLVALVAGIFGFVFVVRTLGWDGIRQAIVGVGAWFGVLAAIDFVGSCCDAGAVHAFVRPQATVRYRYVFAAQLSGIAINRLTPGNTLGEPVKIAMLVRAEVPGDVAVSAIVLFNLTTMYVAIASVVVGVPLTALLLDLPPDLERWTWIAMFVLIGLAVVLYVLVRRGALALGVSSLERMKLVSGERAARWRSRVAAIDARLRSIGDVRAPGFARGVVGVLGSRVCNWAGTIVVLYATHIPMTAPLVIASLSVGILVTWLSSIVPLGLGLADGTNYALYGLLGASPVAGLLFTIVNRLRTILLASIGLVVMGIANVIARRGTLAS